MLKRSKEDRLQNSTPEAEFQETVAVGRQASELLSNIDRELLRVRKDVSPTTARLDQRIVETTQLVSTGEMSFLEGIVAVRQATREALKKARDTIRRAKTQGRVRPRELRKFKREWLKARPRDRRMMSALTVGAVATSADGTAGYEGYSSSGDSGGGDSGFSGGSDSF